MTVSLHLLQKAADNAFLSLGGDTGAKFVTARDGIIEAVFQEAEKLGANS